MDTVALDRSQVVAFRAHTQGLEAPSDAVLGVGVQDSPPGQTAHLALRTRAPGLAVRDRVRDGALPLVYSVRGAMHVHRAEDLGRLAAALRLDDNAAPAVMSFGRFGADLARAGVELPAAVAEVAAAMRRVTADRTPRSKGELSGAVTPLVDARLAPWCGGCGVHHVHDGLWRYATLQAGLRLVYDGGPGGFRLLPAAGAAEPADRDAARAELTRRYLHLAGPATPHQLAAWLGLTPAAARRWWRLPAAAGELVEVTVDGARRWSLRCDLDLLRDAPAPRRVVLLPPYDPVAALADRELLVPDPRRRRHVWRAATNPGLVLARGELVGIWRHRTHRDRLELAVTAFGEADRAEVTADAERLAAAMGLGSTTVRWEAGAP